MFGPHRECSTIITNHENSSLIKYLSPHSTTYRSRFNLLGFRVYRNVPFSDMPSSMHFFRRFTSPFGGEYFLELTILGFLPILLVTISFHIQNMSGLSAKNLAGENRPLRRSIPEHEPSFRQSLPKSKHIFQIWIWYGGQHCKHGHTLPSYVLILNISRSLGIR